MFIKDDHKIKIFQRDGIELKGYYFENNKDSCVVCFAGLGGTCDNMFCAIADEVVNSGLSFFFGNTQASYKVKELKQKLADEETNIVLRGGAYEDYDETIKDMMEWLKYIADKGFKKIYLVGASLACNRLVSLLNTKQYPNIKKLVLICPQDVSVQVDQDMMAEANQNISSNKGDELLTQKLFGFCEICGRTYHDLFSRKDINNLPYLTEGADFTMLKAIDIPIFAIIGECDQGLSYSNLSAEDAMKRLKQYNSNFRYEIIANAKHSFKNYEQELAKLVVKYLKEE